MNRPGRIFILGLAVIAPGFAPAQRDYTAEECAESARLDRLFAPLYQRMWVFRRAREIRPQRRDSPLRYLNVSDDEVREIQAAASEIVGNVLVTISGVVAGCPCEDGANCTDQVWVYAHQSNDTIGLLLSKVSGHWQIGTVQRWWLTYEPLEAKMEQATTYEARKSVESAQDRLIDLFPMCGVADKLKEREESRRKMDQWHGCKAK